MAEGLVVNLHKSKYNFTEVSLWNFKVALCIKPDLIFIPERR